MRVIHLGLGLGLLLLGCSSAEDDATGVAEAAFREQPHIGVGKRILFDAAHGQTAGNADWVIDADACDRAQRHPTPSPREVAAERSGETAWSGAFSAFGVALARSGFDLESLPPGERLSYGDVSSPQDLSTYDVLVVPEPNTPLAEEEKRAIRRFVEHGGGLFMIADHASADRDNDGWAAAAIFDDLMAPVPWGIHFQLVGERGNNVSERHGANYTTDTSSPIIHAGPFGRASSKGLLLAASTVMTLDPSANPSARGHVWLSRTPAGSTTDVTFATSTWGVGRIAAIGDSSPVEDDTPSCGGRVYPGFTDASHDNALILMNAVAWLAGSGSGSGSEGSPTVIQNGGFEDGLAPWQVSGRAGLADYHPRTGGGYLYLGSAPGVTGSAWQEIDVPPDRATLTFWLAVAGPATTEDLLHVEVDDGSSTSAIAVAASEGGSPGAYARRGPYDLSAHAGRRVRLRLRAVTTTDTTFRVDDVEIR